MKPTKLRISITLLAAAYAPFAGYIAGWNFERGAFAALIAFAMPVLALIAYTCPFLPDDDE